MKDNKKTVAQMGAALVIIGTLIAICTALYHLIQNMRAKKLVSEGELKNLYNDIKSYENRLKSLKKELDSTIREYKNLQSTYADYANTMGNPRTSSTTYSHSSNGVNTSGTTYGVNPAFNPDMAAKYAKYSNQYRAIVLRYMEIKKDMKVTKSNLRNAEKSLLMMARKGYTPSEVESMEKRLNDLFDKVDTMESQMSDTYKEYATEEDCELFYILNEMDESDSFLNDFDNTFIENVLTESISYDQAVSMNTILNEKYDENTKKMKSIKNQITNMKLSIYEKAMNGEITEEQKDALLDKCDKTIEEAGFSLNRFGTKEEQKEFVKKTMEGKPHISLDSLEDDDEEEDETKKESVDALFESSADDADFTMVEEHLNLIEKAIEKLDFTFKSVRMTPEQKTEFEKYHKEMAQLLKKAKILKAALRPLRSEYREAINDAKDKAKFYNQKKIGGAQNFNYDPVKAKDYQIKFNKYKALDAKFKSLKATVKEMCKEVKRLNRKLHTLVRKCDGNYTSIEDSIDRAMDKLIDAHNAYMKSTVSYRDKPVHDSDFEESTDIIHDNGSLGRLITNLEKCADAYKNVGMFVNSIKTTDENRDKVESLKSKIINNKDKLETLTKNTENIKRRWINLMAKLDAASTSIDNHKYSNYAKTTGLLANQDGKYLKTVGSNVLSSFLKSNGILDDMNTLNFQMKLFMKSLESINNKAEDIVNKNNKVDFNLDPMHKNLNESTDIMDDIVKESMETGEPMEALIYRSCGEGKINRETAESLISRLSSID